MNTYSFQDVISTFSCPNVGTKSTEGAGIGSIAIAMTQTKTVQEMAADGTPMISKILGENGTIIVTMQQTSQLHKYLLNWYNYINTTGSTNEWAAMTVTINSNALSDSITATGVSPQKVPDRNYQAQGQNVTWTLMAAKIVQS